MAPSALPRLTPSVVVFDLGGVLVDWDPRYLYRQLLPDEAAVEKFLAEVCTPEWNAAQDAGRPWAEGVAVASARFPDQAELIAAFDERWAETLGGEIAGSVEALRDLRVRGVRLYALTNWSAEKFDLTIPRFKWLSWFDGIVVSGHERIVKPDPRIFAILLERYGLDPSSTVYVDDVEANVETARALGMVSLLFTGPVRLRNDLGRLGVLADVHGGARRSLDP
ncbi:MAG: HAD family hydrolase [Acidimicrobiales bacterium]